MIYIDVGSLTMLASSWGIALVFGLIALWALKKKTPMHFWSGTTVKPEEITDIPAYNRANAKMWAIFGACFFVIGIVGLFSIGASGVLTMVVGLPGVFVLIKTYNKIYKKYEKRP